MEGIGSERAVRSRDFCRSSPLVLNGGMVHRHIYAANAYALGMGFQHIGFFRVNDDAIGSRDGIGSTQCYPDIAVTFHTGKGSCDIQGRDSHIGYLCAALAIVLRQNCNILRNGSARIALFMIQAGDGTARDIDIRTAFVDDARIAYAHAETRAYGDRCHSDVGTFAFFLLSLQGFDGDILASDRSLIKGHIRIVVHMDNGIRDAHGSAAHSDSHIFLRNVAGLFCQHIDIVRGR